MILYCVTGVMSSVTRFNLGKTELSLCIQQVFRGTSSCMFRQYLSIIQASFNETFNLFSINQKGV